MSYVGGEEDADSTTSSEANDEDFGTVGGYRQAVPVGGKTAVGGKSMKAMGDGGMKALVGAVEREQEELAEKHAGKAAVTVRVHVPHERHSFTCAAMEGDNLMEVAQAHPDLLGAYLECACGGHAACSTCHVIVDEAHFAGLPPADEAELDMVDLAYGVTDTSRLGCQIVLNADGIEITLPSGVNNHW